MIPDVPVTHRYAKSIYFLYAVGIVRGVDDDVEDRDDWDDDDSNNSGSTSGGGSNVSVGESGSGSSNDGTTPGDNEDSTDDEVIVYGDMTLCTTPVGDCDIRRMESLYQC